MNIKMITRSGGSLLVSFALVLQLYPSFALSSPATTTTYIAAGVRASKIKINSFKLLSKGGKSIIGSVVSSVALSAIGGLLSNILSPSSSPSDHIYVIQLTNGTKFPLKLVKAWKKGNIEWPLKKTILLPGETDFALVDGKEFEVAAAYQLQDPGNPGIDYIVGAYRNQPLIGKSKKRMLLQSITQQSDTLDDSAYTELAKYWQDVRQMPTEGIAVQFDTNQTQLAGVAEVDTAYKLKGGSKEYHAASWQFSVVNSN